MVKFRYEAFTAAGSLTLGEMEGGSVEAVISQLQESGHVPISATEIGGHGIHGWLRRDLFPSIRISRNELAIATRELSTFLKSGLPLDRALSMVVELTESAKAQTLFSSILASVRNGSNLADALAEQKDAIPSFYVTMIRAGEIGGALEATLARLSDYLGKAHAATEAIKSALIYPIVLVTVAGLSLSLVLTVVLPQFKPIFQSAGVSLPLPTRIVMMAGDLVQQFWWLGLLVGVLSAVGFRRGLQNPEIALRWHRFLLHVPILGDLIAKTETSRFGRTLGTLTANGVALPTALALSQETLENRVMAEAVISVTARLKEGEGLSEPLAQTRVFPQLAIQLMRVGEETGRLDEMLIDVADIYDREVQRTTERLFAILTPALTIGLGVIIAFIIASVLLALLAINRLVT